MSSATGPDVVFAALDPLVRDGTLTGAQADRVYQSVTRELPDATDVDDGRLPRTADGWNQTRLAVGLAVLGAGLVLASFWVPAFLTGNQLDFTSKLFLAMLVASAAEAGAAAVSLLLLGGRRHGRWLVGVFVSLAVLTLPIAVMFTWDPDILVYVGGIVMMAGGIAGFWLLRSHPAVLLAGFGGLVVLVQIFTDTLEGSEDAAISNVTTSGVAAMVYGLAVAAAGWRFACRNTAGLLGGAIALGSMYYVIVTLGFVGPFAFSVAGQSLEATLSELRGDIRLAMMLGLLVMLALVVAHALTGHVGFLIEAFVGAGSLPFLGVGLASGQHPLRWAFGIGLVGAALIAVGLVQALRKDEAAVAPVRPSGPASRQQPGAPPPPHLGPGETVSW